MDAEQKRSNRITQAAIGCTLLACVPIGIASQYVAMYLFSLNAPMANEQAHGAYSGLLLFPTFLFGGMIGVLTVYGAMSRKAVTCIRCGAIASVALYVFVCLLGSTGLWVSFDMLMLPALLVVLLCIWGVYLKYSDFRQ